ncbi:unnamed protein product [Rhizophagus irregularis]|nr:unnamed protein product [Rhizophagus irregularis]
MKTYKICIIFVILFSLLIVGINTEGDTPKKECEDYFNVSTCNECQKELWDSWSNPSSCGFFIRLIMNIIEDYGNVAEHNHLVPYNVTPYYEAVKETCDEKFSCNYDEAESLWKKVEEKCPNELTTKVDWSADPSTLDRTVTGAYATVIFYYFGIPDHNFMCLKTSNGELCGIETTKPFIKWLKEKIPEGKFRPSYDHKYVYREDGTRIEIPRELISCGECQQKMAKTYKYWPVNHPLPDYIVKNIFGSWDHFNNYFTCPNDNSKIKLKRRFSRRNIN